MARLHYVTPTLGPPAIGLYSQIAIYPAAQRVATISGQVAVDLFGQIPLSIEGQTWMVMEHVKTLMGAVHATPADLINLRFYLVFAADLEPFQRVRGEVYSKWFPGKEDVKYPTSTVLLVSGLARPEFLVEVEGQFLCP